MTPVPSLDDLAGDPTKAASLSPETARTLTFRCLTALAALAAAPGAMPVPVAEGPGEERLLSVEEVARTLGVSEDWLYRRAPRLPFTVRLGRTLRFSAKGLERYIRSKQAR